MVSEPGRKLSKFHRAQGALDLFDAPKVLRHIAALHFLLWVNGAGPGPVTERTPLDPNMHGAAWCERLSVMRCVTWYVTRPAPGGFGYAQTNRVTGALVAAVDGIYTDQHGRA